MEAAHRRSATSASALLVTDDVDDDDKNKSGKSNVNLGIMVYISNHQTTTTSNDSAKQEQQPVLKRQKIHRIDTSTLCLTSGLDGDGRLLVRHLRKISNRESHYENNDNGACNVRVLAKESGNVQHQLTLTPGARPLGVAVTLLGLLPPTAATSDFTRSRPRPLGLFQCEAGGMTVDSCECTASGIGRDKVRFDLVEFLRDLKQNDDGGGGHAKAVDFIKGTTKIVLKRYLEQQNPSLSSNNSSGLFKNNSRRRDDADGNELTKSSSSSSNNNNSAATTLVDIYLVKPNPKCRGGVQISCALSVPACDLDRVANLFAEEVCVGDFDNDDDGIDDDECAR